MEEICYVCQHLNCKQPVGSQLGKMKMDDADLAKSLHSGPLLICVTEGDHTLETRTSEMLKGFIIILASTGR